MIAGLIFLFFIFSSGLFGNVYFKKKFEDTLAISFTGVVFVLFLSGVLGHLKVGVFLLFIIFPLLFVSAVVKIYKDKNIKEVFSDYFSSGFCIFIILTIFFTYTLYGKLYSGHDEFSHWGDVVKAMTIYDVFATNSVMNSLFPTYPPGMSLLLYFIEEINITLLKGEYIEYISVIGSSMYTVAFILPAFRFIKKKPVDIIMTAIVIIFIPQFLFYSAYTYLYIDGFLGLTFGAALLQILCNKEKDICYDAYIVSSAFILTIAKDAGMLLAVLILVTYIIDRIMLFEKGNDKHALIQLLARITISPLLSIALGKVLWNYCIKRDGATKVFASRYDISDYFGVITGKVQSYRKTSFDNFISEIFSSDTLNTYSGVRLSYVGLFLILSIAITVLVCILIKKKEVNKSTAILFIVMAIFSMVIYTWGLQITYMYNFSEYDAIILTSFWRYMNIGFVGIWIDAFILLVQVLYDKRIFKYIGYGFILLVILLTNPVKFEKTVINRQFVSEAAKYRKDVNSFAEKIKETVPVDASIYYVNQEGEGMDLYVMHTEVRPCRITNWSGYSLGNPKYEDDWDTVFKSSTEFMDELVESYDYLAIHDINEEFIQLYGELFEKGSEPVRDGIYIIDKENKCLVKQ